MARTTIRSEDIADGEILVADVADDSITNAKIKSDAAIAATKLAGTLDLSSKTVTLPAASVTAHVTAFNDDLIQNNIAVLAFKMAISESLTKFGMVDQVIDNFQDTSGVDSGASSQYTKTSNYYSGLGLAAQIDTSSTTPIGTMSQSAALSAGFDGNTAQNNSNSCYKDPSAACWLGQDWGSGNTKTPNRYKMWSATDNQFPGGSNSYYALLQGSANNSSWTTLHTESSMPTGVAQTVDVTSGITTTTAYRYHRIYFQGDGNGGTIAELQFFDLSGVGDMTLVSATTTAEATPTTADLVFLLEDGAGSNTLGTDVKAYVSRNGNANYSSALTLVDEGDLDSTRKIITARNVDISGLTGTTAMRWKITTHNQSAAKEARIHAVSLGWS